jgi:hypothetical protein
MGIIGQGKEVRSRLNPPGARHNAAADSLEGYILNAGSWGERYKDPLLGKHRFARLVPLTESLHDDSLAAIHLNDAVFTRPYDRSQLAGDTLCGIREQC